MATVERFLEKRLKLKVNRHKSAVGRPDTRKFLGFSLSGGEKPLRCIAASSLGRFKSRIRELTFRTRGRSIEQVVERLRPVIRGWRGYYGFCETPFVLRNLDGWIRRRLRSLIWRQWQSGRNRYRMLLRSGIRAKPAAQTAKCRSGPWSMSRHPVVQQALSNAFFLQLGLPILETRHAA
jgi:RNA-directed DNA polymerase